MGPRRRRRAVGLLATVVALAIFGVALFYFTRSGSPTGMYNSSRVGIGEFSGRVPFGATPKQVQRTLGSPTSKQPGCWVYRANADRVNGAYLPQWVDALKFCFSAGPAGSKGVTNIYNHLVAHPIPLNKHFAGGWFPAINVEHGKPPQ
jgi:hypothetical protein